uniref:Uncharacterized protein n=1 Tax=Glossina austeni TaxID=7395 RepID=A0A1A9UWM4_GLOAU
MTAGYSGVSFINEGPLIRTSCDAGSSQERERERERALAKIGEVGNKAELKQRLVEYHEKEGEGLSVLEIEYDIEGRKQTDNLEGEDSANVSNTAVMQFIQQQMQQMQKQTQQQMQHMQQQMQQQIQQQMQQQMQQQTQQQGQQIESKIDIVQKNQRILQTHTDETYQQFESKVNVLEEKVDNAIGLLDARIDAQEKNADAVKNEIKALKKELAKQQTNDITTSSIKVKTLIFDGTTNFNALKLQFGVVAQKICGRTTIKQSP